MGFIGRAWRGETRLWVVYWVYGVLLTTAVMVSYVLLSMTGILGAIVSGLGLLAWVVWLNVSMWRCAFNAYWRVWGYIVRFLVIINTIVFVVTFVMTISQGGLSQPEGLAASVKSEGVAQTQPMPTPSPSVCEQQMATYAISQKADPKAYIAANQAWLNQCISNAASGK